MHVCAYITKKRKITKAGVYSRRTLQSVSWWSNLICNLCCSFGNNSLRAFSSHNRVRRGDVKPWWNFLFLSVLMVKSLMNPIFSSHICIKWKQSVIDPFVPGGFLWKCKTKKLDFKGCLLVFATRLFCLTVISVSIWLYQCYSFSWTFHFEITLWTDITPHL